MEAIGFEPMFIIIDLQSTALNRSAILSHNIKNININNLNSIFN